MISRENKRVHIPDKPSIYQIRISGHLDCKWSDWFDGMVITLEKDGDTLLTGPVADQAALYGLFKKVRDLGMTLVSVNPVLSDQTERILTGRRPIIKEDRSSRKKTNKQGKER